MARPGACWITVRLVLPSIGIFVGLFVAIVFYRMYHNYSTAAWGVLTACTAAALLITHIVFGLKRLVQYACLLLPITVLALVLVSVAIAGFVIYLIIAVTEKQGLDPHGRAYYITIVWCFMTFKFAVQLAWFSYVYWLEAPKLRAARAGYEIISSEDEHDGIGGASTTEEEVRVDLPRHSDAVNNAGNAHAHHEHAAPPPRPNENVTPVVNESDPDSKRLKPSEAAIIDVSEVSAPTSSTSGSPPSTEANAMTQAPTEVKGPSNSQA